MAQFRLTNGYVSIAGVDLSDHAYSLDISQSREQVEISGFNSGGYKSFLPGSSDETVTIGFRQDFASSKVHQTLQPLYANSSTFVIVIAPNGSSISATNPAFQGTAALFEYQGLNGEFGDVSNISAVLKSGNPSSPLAWATA